MSLEIVKNISLKKIIKQSIVTLNILSLVCACKQHRSCQHQDNSCITIRPPPKQYPLCIYASGDTINTAGQRSVSVEPERVSVFKPSITGTLTHATRDADLGHFTARSQPRSVIASPFICISSVVKRVRVSA